MQSLTIQGTAKLDIKACCPRLLRPARVHHTTGAFSPSFAARPSLRRSGRCYTQRLSPTAAQEQPDREPSVDNGQIQSPTGSDLRPQVSESKLPAETKAEPRVGLAGSIVMWGFLVVSKQYRKNHVGALEVVAFVHYSYEVLTSALNAVSVCWVIVLYILKVISARHATP